VNAEADTVSALLQSIVSNVIDRTTNDSGRSRQAAAGILGVSDVGVCREYVRRVIVREQPSQTPHTYDLAAFVGTAVGDHIESAFVDMFPQREWVKQTQVEVRLQVRDYLLTIPGHPDLFSRTDLIDFKTRDGLGVVRRTGPTDQERYQRALYAYALIEAGLMDSDCWVHNVYLDRSGADNQPVVWSERYDPAVITEAAEWLSDALYAVEMGEEASRDKPREWCWACCPFAPKCRGEDDTDVEGRVDDPVFIDAVRVYTDAKAIIAAAEKDKKSAASVLRDVSGTVGDFKVRWVNVGPTVVPEQHRSGFSRLDVRAVNRRKRYGNDGGAGVGSADVGMAEPDERPSGDEPLG
jgi:hypothetical protein